jgi:hypothetical protein
MKKEWKVLELEVLDVRMTMQGSPDISPDLWDKDGIQHLDGPS